uniref:BTB and MATH domain-containing protein 43 n=1 Tax=Lygus hesperus TaxID=30085 RepID=A0A146L299_LYGHE
MGFPHFQHASSQALDPGLFAEAAPAREGEQMDPRSFAILYDHMFTGGLPPGEEVTWSLLWAARQFRLKRLAIFCEVHLALQVDVWNAAFFLIQSQKFASHNLWAAILKFVAQALPFVSETPGWLLLQDHPSLLTEIMDQRLRGRSRSTMDMGHFNLDRSSQHRKKKKSPLIRGHGPLKSEHFPPPKGPDGPSQMEQQ